MKKVKQVIKCVKNAIREFKLQLHFKIYSRKYNEERGKVITKKDKELLVELPSNIEEANIKLKELYEKKK